MGLNVVLQTGTTSPDILGSLVDRYCQCGQVKRIMSGCGAVMCGARHTRPQAAGDMRLRAAQTNHCATIDDLPFIISWPQ